MPFKIILKYQILRIRYHKVIFDIFVNSILNEYLSYIDSHDIFIVGRYRL